jgi:hypothetical protein
MQQHEGRADVGDFISSLQVLVAPLLVPEKTESANLFSTAGQGVAALMPDSV